jgi:hypothetical protein
LRKSRTASAAAPEWGRTKVILNAREKAAVAVEVSAHFRLVHSKITEGRTRFVPFIDPAWIGAAFTAGAVLASVIFLRWRR